VNAKLRQFFGCRSANTTRSSCDKSRQRISSHLRISFLKRVLLRECVSWIPSLVSLDVGRYVLDVLTVSSILILTFRDEIPHFARLQFVGS
jgi:hypothetical protein